MSFIAAGAAAVLLGGAFVTDIWKGKISNKWTLLFFAGAIVFHLLANGLGGVMVGIMGAAAGFLPLLLLYMVKGIGAGDVKLFGALGAWIGVGAVLQVLLYSIWYAGAIAICMILFNRAFSRRLALGTAIIVSGQSAAKRQQWRDWATSGTSFPFMLAAVPAAATAALQLI